LSVLTKLNGVITVTEKLFSQDMQNYTINNSGIFKELEKNQRQTKKDTIQKGMKKNES
jgi:hypothetical protein